MLYGDTPHTHRQPYGPVSKHLKEAPSTDLASVLRSISYHWRVVLASVIAALFVAALYLIVMPTQYSASMLLLIDPKFNITLRPQPAFSDANAESANIESQAEILKSEHVARLVVQALNLDSDPALAPGWINTVFGGAVRTLKLWSQDHAPTGTEAKINLTTRLLIQRVSVKRLGLTYVVEITTQMPDPTLAARTANAFAQVYMDNQLALREQVARRTSKLLQERTLELQQQATAAEREVEELKFSGSVEGRSSADARVALRDLESVAQTYRLLHDKFLERFAETSQQQYISMSDALVVSPAVPPTSKSSPRISLVLSAALFLGFSIGAAIALLKEHYRPTVLLQVDKGVPALRSAEAQQSE